MNNRIPNLVQEWADSISHRDSRQMTDFYSRNAILLATYESLLVGRPQIKGYFNDFLDKENLQCEIITNYTKVSLDKDIVIANGLYEFSFSEKVKPQNVLARYTYVIARDNNPSSNGKIITHHSSENPE